jgi:photoactive yellow protein
VRDGEIFNELPFGWIELDATGMVTRYKPADEKRGTSQPTPDLVGCNLFRDIAPIAQVAEFRDRFQFFVQSPLPSEVFNLTFNASDTSIQARVMLAQVIEKHRSGSEKLVLLRFIRA